MVRTLSGVLCLLLLQGCANAAINHADAGCRADGRDDSFRRRETYIPAAGAPVGVAVLGNRIGHGVIDLIKVEDPPGCPR